MKQFAAGFRADLTVERSRFGRIIALTAYVILSIIGNPSGLHAQQRSPRAYAWPTAALPTAAFRIPSGAAEELLIATPGDAFHAPLLADADLAAGIREEDRRQEGCVDLYYRAASRAWSGMAQAEFPSAGNPHYQRAWQTYQQSLARLIPAACRFGRLDPRAQLVVNDGGQRHAVRIAYHGFAWRPDDFCQVVAASEFAGSDLKCHYRTPGLGMALVAIRHTCAEEQYYRRTQPFAVTAVLRPAQPECAIDAVLEFYNPQLFETLAVGPSVLRLERDLSAPFASLAEEKSRQYLRGFFDPGETDVRPKLFMIEPHQRGKIPVIFIHGLLSEPVTWLDAVNELRAQPDLYRQYQFWYFRYPTGGALLESAAQLREQLQTAREQFDNARQDRAWEHMVLVGHSMGGLMARLQVTYAYDILWRHAARQSLEAVRTTPDMRQRIQRDFFFDPSPLVSRVVFVGTPHRGAGMARRLAAQAVSSLVRPFGAEEPLYRQLMDQNRAVFYEYLWDSPPTSIDLLEPDNPLLKALAQMPFRRGIRLHSIIGTGGRRLIGEPGDGVVPVSSARLAGVCSEMLVPARHAELHHDAATLAELKRILGLHAREIGP